MNQAVAANHRQADSGGRDGEALLPGCRAAGHTAGGARLT